MTRDTERFVLLTGSDTGNREFHLSEAKHLISERIGAIFNTSSIIETEPWGFESDTLFLNQALLVETELQPIALLDALQKIEIEVGRMPHTKQWSSRIIDIDILCAENRIHHCERLTIPHKWLHKRSFALKPLFELAPDWKHPLLKIKYVDLLREVCDEQPTAKMSV